MKNKKTIMFSIYSIIAFSLIVCSAFYRIKVNDDLKSTLDKSYVKDEKLKGKTIVRVWIRKDNVSSTRAYQVEKFNDQNKDVCLMYSTYKEDYDNLVKTAIASDKGPDIMTYSFFEQIKDKKVINLKEVGIDTDKIENQNLVYYNGQPYGTKLIEQNVKFLWNKDIFKQAGLDPSKGPTTWEEVVKYSKIIKEKCPEVTPVQFPMNDYQDFKASIGEPSVNKGNIYTTFWDYSRGKYDFSYSKDILNIYNELYSNKLIDKDFYKKSRNELRTNFYKGNVAMFLSTFEDKGYFSNIIPLDFQFGISDIPKISIKDSGKYYFLANSNFLCVNDAVKNKTDKEKQAVRKVYQWLASEETNREILKTKMAISPIIKNTKVDNDEYGEYNKVDNVKTEKYDPSIFISRDSQKTMDLSIDAITGKKTIEESINELNKNYKEYCDFTSKYRGIKLYNYKK